MLTAHSVRLECRTAGKNVAVAGSSAAVDASGQFLYAVTDAGLT